MRLPSGWKRARIRDVCLPISTTKPVEDPERSFTYVDISSVNRSSLQVEHPQQLLGKDAPSRARQVIKEGDILFSTVRPNLRTLASVPQEFDGQIASTGFCVLRPGPELSSPFLFYAVLDERFQQRVTEKARGVSYPAVRDPDILDEEIFLPSRDEQDEIVTAIGTAMEAIGIGGTSLREARRLAHAYRAASLEHICLGRFLRGGRGHTAEGLPSLPKGWTWIALRDLASDEARAITDGPFGSNLKGSHYTDAGPRVVRLQNIGDGEFRDEKAHIAPEHYERLRAHAAVPGDVVVVTGPHFAVHPERELMGG